MGIGRMHRLFLSGRMTPSQLLTWCLARAERTERVNRAVVTSQEAQILFQEAASSDERYNSGNHLGPLDGIPVLVKDNICMAGLRTTLGSRALEQWFPAYSATVVTRLQAAGAIILGKTNLDEFAMGSGTVDSAVAESTRNPWTARTELADSDDWYIAGGSSGGSGAAVAAGLGLAALGSDTGGSGRNPGAYCGLVALKPTYGRLSRWGLVPLTNGIEQVSLITRQVSDAALLLGYLAGPDDRDSTCIDPPDRSLDLKSPDQLRVGLPREFHAPGTDHQVLQGWDQVAQWLSESGCQLENIDLPLSQYTTVCYSVLNAADVASNMARYDGLRFGYSTNSKSVSSGSDELLAATRSHSLNQVVRGRVLAGNYFLLRKNRQRYLERAARVWRLLRDEMLDVFSSGVDVVLTPATPRLPSTYSRFVKQDNRTRMVQDDIYLMPANLTGVPALVLPVGLSSNGLPLSVQLIAAPWREDLLFSVAQIIEKRARFSQLTHLPVSQCAGRISSQIQI